jgi:hypothetical protein
VAVAAGNPLGERRGDPQERHRATVHIEFLEAEHVQVSAARRKSCSATATATTFCGHRGLEHRTVWMLGGIKSLRWAGNFASPPGGLRSRRAKRGGRGAQSRERASAPLPHFLPARAARPHPNLCSHFWSATRVSTQGPLLFGRGSGRIASPAQRERPPTEGRRVRASAPAAQAPCSKPYLPSPGALRAPASPRFAGRGNMAPGPSRVLSSLRVGVHFLQSYGCSRCGVGGLSRNLGNDEARAGRGNRKCQLGPTALRPPRRSGAQSRPLCTLM